VTGGAGQAESPLWPDVLGHLLRREDLPVELVERAMATILEGKATDAQIAGFAVALRAKGETVAELAALVRTMLSFAERVELPNDSVPVVDTCGTGGDRSHTINVSTLAALVVAGAGVRVAKHGNRAASSACGSADLLEELGVVIDLGPAGVARCIETAGIGFCFAQKFHPCMRFAGPPRKELGVATTFNFLGPLANPARVRRQVLGVSDPGMAERMAGALAELGSERALVFCGDDGLDELTTTTASTVHELDGGTVRSYSLDPAEYGFARADPVALVGGDAAHNADITKRVLGGEPGPQRDVVVLNAAAALVAAGVAADLSDGIDAASSSIDEGRAAATLDAFVRASTDARDALADG
jgi:anthranilate phosphoribosyltransferase